MTSLKERIAEIEKKASIPAYARMSDPSALAEETFDIITTLQEIIDIQQKALKKYSEREYWEKSITAKEVLEKTKQMIVHNCT